MAKITWTSEANNWLKKIYDFIAEDSPKAATNVVNGIYKKSQILKINPHIGYIYEHESSEEIRILLYGHYRITYLIKSDKEVIILGVFHGALLIEHYIKLQPVAGD